MKKEHQFVISAPKNLLPSFLLMKKVAAHNEFDRESICVSTLRIAVKYFKIASKIGELVKEIFVQPSCGSQPRLTEKVFVYQPSEIALNILMPIRIQIKA